ncbi:MAG: type II toxin-antitoxin system VapB family antitoxin [Hyphomicrobiales bacterium]
MTLQIRDERADKMARELADRLHTTKTEAVIRSLEEMLKLENNKLTVQDQMNRIADELAKRSARRGPDLTKDEIDRLWGHED